MPKYDQLYRAKKPLLQMKILKSIAMSGRLSQKEAIAEFRCKPSTISDAFKTMKDRTKLIEATKHPGNLSELEEGLNREKFYKLSFEGLLRFIEENIKTQNASSPAEFWVVMIWYGFLNSEIANKDEFNRCYDLFIERFIGTYPLRSCFFLGNLFDNLFQQWRRDLEHKCESDFADDLISQTQDMFRHNSDCSMKDRRREETEKAYKVLECLLLNRGITINKIVELTRLKAEEVREIIQEHSMTQSRYSEYIDNYEYVYQSSRSEDVTINFLNHLLIVPVKTKKVESNDQKYELSLLGVLLFLAMLSLERRREEDNTYSNYYDKAASNYREKLPLIFEKWKLLKKTLDDRLDRYPSIFDYLFLDKAEILSLSVSLGGNKEIYDNVKTATMHAIYKFSIVYDDWISAIEAFPHREAFKNTQRYRFIQKKINEMKISLSFTTITSFGKYMKEKKESVYISPTFEDDLHSIENKLADEFSFSFYVGLLRENMHLASDYPLTSSFLGDQSRDFHVPIQFLNQIVADDDQIRDKLKEWITESIIYQEQALKKMNHIDQGLMKKITVG
jgi:hypothetical protein